MKLLQVASMCGMAFASFEQMSEDLSATTNRYVRGLMAEGASARNIPEILGSSLDNINEYGCWCYFQDDHGRGHGKPLNGVDRFCKKLADGYDCAIFDVIEDTGNDTCVPWEIFYISGVGGGEVGLIPTCEAVNGDPCAVDACKVEGIFVLKIFNLFISGDQADPSFSHANGFNEKDGCQLEEGREDPNRLCCGSPPDRVPYKPLGGDRDCCQTPGETKAKVFDALIFQCCPDGTPRISC